MSEFEFETADKAARAQRREEGASAGPTADSGPGATLRNLQRAAGNAAVGELLQRDEAGGGAASVKNIVGKGGGSPLPDGVRGSMESSMGADFSDVRVHDSSEADASAKAVNAHAYTVGNDVVFQSGRYDPGSTDGQKTLAHELTHVVQQRQGPVDGTNAGGGVKISDPNDRFEREADSVAEQVVSRQQAGGDDHAGHDHSGHDHGDAPEVQRQGGEEEELQGMHVQRQEEEEESMQAMHVQRQEEEEESMQAMHVQREGGEEEESMQAMHVQRQEEEEESMQAMHVQREGGEEEESMQAMHVQRVPQPEEEGAAPGGHPGG